MVNIVLCVEVLKTGCAQHTSLANKDHGVQHPGVFVCGCSEPEQPTIWHVFAAWHFARVTAGLDA